MKKEDLAENLIYAYCVLEEKKEILTLHEAIEHLDELRKLPRQLRELLVELLVELNLAKFVELPHPIPELGVVRGIMLQKNADLEFDPYKFSGIDVDDILVKIQNRNDESEARNNSSNKSEQRKVLTKTKRKYDSLCEQIAITEMAIIGRRSDIEAYRARIAAGITRADIARAFQLCIEEHSRLQARLRDLVDKRDQLAYKLSLID